MHLYTIRKKLLKQRRFRQTLIGAFLVAFILGILIVPVESRSPHTKIHTTSDGLWWAVQTLTTVGYGDTVPVTDAGRLMGVLMQMVGAILFGVVIAMISTTMSRSQEEFYWTRLFSRLDELERQVTYLEKSELFQMKKEQPVGTNPPSADTKVL